MRPVDEAAKWGRWRQVQEWLGITRRVDGEEILERRYSSWKRLAQESEFGRRKGERGSRV
jgi:hypothetical protein